MELKLTSDQATSAAQVQLAIDRVALEGGCVILPELELVLDRGLRLRSGVELVGQGPGTLLRQGQGRVYALSGYHNYGMADVPLEMTEGLEPGMTVSVHDDRTHGGFYETLAVITWVDGNWIGLDHGVEADYQATANPCLTTVYPLVMGHGIGNAALRDLRLEGCQPAPPKPMGGCRGGAVYLANSADVEVSGVTESGYRGEGLSFQMCRDIRIADCRFDGNTGNGLHPGAGSTNVLFERCSARGNGRSGFFFCVRANHITVRHCEFHGNDTGLSIGTRDCHNLIEDCAIEDNRASGVLVRESPRPTEVHSCALRRCRIWGNARAGGGGQVEIVSDAHDLIVADCELGGTITKPAVCAAPSVRSLYLSRNRYAECATEVAAAAAVLTAVCPEFACGQGTLPPTAFRHLHRP